MVEIWTHAVASPRGVMKTAIDLEKNGWDGLCVVDSQNLSGDPFVALAMAATVTEFRSLGMPHILSGIVLKSSTRILFLTY